MVYQIDFHKFGKLMFTPSIWRDKCNCVYIIACRKVEKSQTDINNYGARLYK